MKSLTFKYITHHQSYICDVYHPDTFINNNNNTQQCMVLVFKEEVK